jgi:hypothetical protein
VRRVAVANRGAAFLRLLAERAAADPAYLAWVVRTYAEVEGRTTTDVLTQLGVTENGAADFLLSLRPGGERFAETLKAICARFEADETALLAVLRELEVLDAFRTDGVSPSGGVAPDAGLLMAARMREQGSRPLRVVENTEVGCDDERSDEGGNDAR